MTMLYGAVICASGVALLGVTQLLAPGLLLHGVQKAGPGLPGAVTAGPPTRRHTGERQTFSVHEVAHNHIEWVGGQGHYDLGYAAAIRLMAEKAVGRA
jgi:hypothetical protein